MNPLAIVMFKINTDIAQIKVCHTEDQVTEAKHNFGKSAIKVYQMGDTARIDVAYVSKVDTMRFGPDETTIKEESKNFFVRKFKEIVG